MDLLTTLGIEITGALIGIFAGTLLALTVDRQSERRRKRHRAQLVLRSIVQEMQENHKTLRNSVTAYNTTPWGKSFYLSSIAWETALAGGDLPDLIGFQLTDSLSAHYALYVRIRYYVDLLTRLWFAPANIDGYIEIRAGFRDAITNTMQRAIQQHSEVVGVVEKRLTML